VEVTLECSRCHRDVWLLIEGVCEDCEVQIEDARAIEAAARAAVTAASLANERRWATLDADEYDREAYEDRVDWEAKQP